MIRLLLPYKYDIKLLRREKSTFLEYHEWVKKPDDMTDEEFIDAVHTTIEIVHAKMEVMGVLHDIGYKRHDNEVEVVMFVESDYSVVAEFLIEELLIVDSPELQKIVGMIIEKEAGA